MPRFKLWILFPETYGFSASYPSLPSPPGLLFAQASQGGVKVLCQGVGFPQACILLWPMDVGEVRAPVPSGARKALNGFACFSQHFSLLLREDWAPGGCCHFTPDPRKNSWSSAVLAYSRTASLRTNLYFFSFKKNFIGVYLLYNVVLISAVQHVEKRELSCTVGGNVKWYSHYGEQ